MKCLHCGQPAIMDKERGCMVHENGGIYMQHCPVCDWEGGKPGSYTRCPMCGSSELRDDHCIQPVSDEVYRKS